MKKIECYQPREIVKMLIYLFLFWTVICCVSVISNNDYFIEGIVCSIFFDMTIFLTIFGICIIIRKWYGRCVKVNFDDITKVVFATLSGKPVDATRIHIYKGKKKVLSLDPVMENYDKMKNYLLDHIGEEKIEIIT